MLQLRLDLQATPLPVNRASNFSRQVQCILGEQTRHKMSKLHPQMYPAVQELLSAWLVKNGPAVSEFGQYNTLKGFSIRWSGLLSVTVNKMVRFGDKTYPVPIHTFKFDKAGGVDWTRNSDEELPFDLKSHEEALAKDFDRYGLPEKMTLTLDRNGLLPTGCMNNGAPEFLREAVFGPDTGEYVFYVHKKLEEGKLFATCVELRRNPTPENKLEAKRHTYWTQYDDGKWYCGAPDGFSYLYGAAEAEVQFREGVAAKLFVHEGAKAAIEIQKRIDVSVEYYSRRKDDGSLPPRTNGVLPEHWLEFLSDSAHIAYVGGSGYVDRVDWLRVVETARDIEAKEIVFCPDNDYVGKKPVKQVSRALQDFDGPVSYINYEGNGFPEAWDLADEVPEHIFESEGGSVGAGLEGLCLPMDWATKMVHVQGTDEMVPILRDKFLQRWLVDDQGLFVDLLKPKLRYKRETFNQLNRSFSDSTNVAGLMEKQATKVISRRVYRPGNPSRLIMEEGEVGLNLFEDKRPRSLPYVDQDNDFFWRMLEHLVSSEEERRELVRWIATLIVFPETRFEYGLLLIGGQGVGKSWLLLLLCRLMGTGQYAVVDESSLFDNAFNSYAYGKRLAICHELYQGSSWKAYNKLKSKMTDPEETINMKNQPEFVAEKNQAFAAASNNGHALKMENDDRRWFVLKTTQKRTPEGLAKKAFEALNSPLMLGRLRQEFEDILLSGKVSRVGPMERVKNGDKAPMTKHKAKMIDDSKSEASNIIEDYLGLLDPGEYVWLDDFKEMLVERHRDVFEKYTRRGTSIKNFVDEAGGHMSSKSERLKFKGENGRTLNKHFVTSDKETYVRLAEKKDPGCKWVSVGELRSRIDSFSTM